MVSTICMIKPTFFSRITTMYFRHGLSIKYQLSASQYVLSSVRPMNHHWRNDVIGKLQNNENLCWALLCIVCKLKMGTHRARPCAWINRMKCLHYAFNCCFHEYYPVLPICVYITSIELIILISKLAMVYYHFSRLISARTRRYSTKMSEEGYHNSGENIKGSHIWALQ